MATNFLSLVARLNLDGTGFNRGLAKAGQEATKFGNQIGSTLKTQLVGAFSVGAMVAWGKSIVDRVDEIKDFAEQTGLSTDQVQRLDFVLQQSGLRFADLQAVMNRVIASGKVSSNVINDLSSALAGIDIGGDATDRLLVSLGKTGPKFRQFLKDIQDARIRSQAPIISEDDIKNIDEANKFLQRLKLQFQAGFAPTLAGDIRGALTETFSGGFLKRILLASGVDVGGELTRAAEDQTAGQKAEAAKIKELLQIAAKEQAREEALKRETDEAEEQVKLFEKMQQIQFKLLSTTDQRSQLEREIKELTIEAARFDTGPLVRRRAAVELAERELALKNLDTPRARRRGNFEPDSDQLARIGGFVGGRASSSDQTLRDIKDKLRQIHEALTIRGITFREN